MTEEQINAALMRCPPLPYSTARDLIDAYESGRESLLFVRATRCSIDGAMVYAGVDPVTNLHRASGNAGNVRGYDVFSENGNEFSPNGRIDKGRLAHRIVRECDWEAALEALDLGPKKVEPKPKVELCVPASDMPGIIAASKLPPPAPITPAPPFMVQLPKNSDGLLTVAPMWSAR